tara:strand:+ start:2630 stop:3109 length:480 start_codon:yes stop_codon:yes gene_type:complete
MTIVNTNLISQVQARIDGLTGSESLEELLLLTKAAEGLILNRADLDNALSARIAAFDSQSTLTELLLANKAVSADSGTSPNVESIIKSVQRGTASAGTVTISAVDMAKSFVSISGSWSNTFGGGGSSSQVVSIKAKLSSPTQITITGTGSADWQVIEYV